ncbi:virulence-associated protein E [Porphyromonas gingivalis]|uniref:VapE domain-containing protein n=1 Tax=Porphyromonas gingivalis TaxID=837 RepID=UPI000BE766C1|nr:VapE domain-containing protein [Porphyromonas gingivalis]ATS06120.1 virulence-associated protein E [Porphyromonas gingivalis]PDP59365.1 virulence-associated protein E [Porphyromonas gingivalis]RZQ66839.1 virulence-associated protein E [Porphyromonas gingivalis]
MKRENSDNISKNIQIEEFLSERYEFRYNTILYRAEYRPRETGNYVAIDRYRINTLKRALDKEINVQTSPENLYSIIESDFSPRINPVQAYFHSLPIMEEAKKGAITALADCVSVANPEKWREYLTKWLVAVVANAMDDRQCRNHTCLVLTGEQGKFKTTFLDLLCPPALSDYQYTGKIYPQKKDVLSLIGQNFIINIDDQLKALNKRDEIEERPHLASFVASVNGNDFLTDPTGSRRFLPFEVLAIDIERAKTIPMDAVYSEAKALLKDGFRYWFNDEEIAELHRNSEAFQVYTAEMELLLRYFTFPSEAETATKRFYMTNSEIVGYLSCYTRQSLSAKRMGEALRKAGYTRECRRINGNPVYVYAVRKIYPEQPP